MVIYSSESEPVLERKNFTCYDSHSSKLERIKIEAIQSKSRTKMNNKKMRVIKSTTTNSKHQRIITAHTHRTHQSTMRELKSSKLPEPNE